MNFESKFVHNIFASNICVKLYKKLSLNKGPRAMTKFSKKSNCDLDLRLTMLKCKADQDIVIFNICVKLYNKISP